jgi:hypothetical protein
VIARRAACDAVLVNGANGDERHGRQSREVAVERSGSCRDTKPTGGCAIGSACKRCGQCFCRQETPWMGDVLVMDQNLFGAGCVHHSAADRTSITIQIYLRFGNAGFVPAFSNSAWRLADRHRANDRQRGQNAIRRQANPCIRKIPMASVARVARLRCSIPRRAETGPGCAGAQNGSRLISAKETAPSIHHFAGLSIFRFLPRSPVFPSRSTTPNRTIIE